jgi:hypothetical protein
MKPDTESTCTAADPTPAPATIMKNRPHSQPSHSMPAPPRVHLRPDRLYQAIGSRNTQCAGERLWGSRRQS